MMRSMISMIDIRIWIGILVVLIIYVIILDLVLKNKKVIKHREQLKLNTLLCKLIIGVIIVILIGKYFGYELYDIRNVIIFRVMLSLLDTVILYVIVKSFIICYRDLNIDLEYRYKQYLNIIFLVLSIIVGSVICYLIYNDYIYLFGYNNEIQLILLLILVVYQLFKYNYKKYIIIDNKNIDSDILEYRLPKHYYIKDNRVYIDSKYKNIGNIYILISNVIIILMCLLSFVVGCIFDVSVIGFENISIVLLSFMILIIFILELRFYFDGVEEKVDTNNSKLVIKKKEENINFSNINLEYSKLWEDKIIKSYLSVNNYNSKIVDSNNNIICNSNDLEFNNFLYSKVLFPIINGDNIIIESCLLDSFSDIIIPIINLMFAASKKMIIICDSMDTVYNLKKWLDNQSKIANMVNSNIVISILDYKNNNSFNSDNNIDIYIGTVDLALDSRIVYENIDVVFGINIDKIISENSLNLSLFAKVLASNKNNLIQYVLFGNRVNGLNSIVSQIFMRNDFKYQVIKSSIKKEVLVNFFKTEGEWLQGKILPNFATQYLGQLIPLAIPSLKYNIKKVDIISNNQPYKEQLLAFQTAQSLLLDYLEDDIINVDDMINFSLNENFVKINDNSVIVAYDNYCNASLLVINYIKYAKKHMLLNIVSRPYLLREYIINNIEFFIGNVEIIGNILPIPKSNIKLAVYKLINQLCYGDMSEEVLLREIQKQDMDILIDINNDNQVRLIIDALHDLTRCAFGVNISYNSYLTYKDVTSLNGIDRVRYYRLLDAVKKELPDNLFKNIIFIDSEENSKIIKKIPVFELYQNYLEGQYIVFDGIYYLVNKIDYNNGIVELVNSNVNTSIRYRQIREINNLKLLNIVKEIPILKVRDSILSKRIICGELDIDTVGYYEFNEAISFVSGEYSYKSVDKNKLGLCRKYKSTNILAINILNKMILEMNELDKFRISFTLSVLLNEMFETLFSDIKQYIIVRSVVKDKSIYSRYLKDELIKLYRPIVDTDVLDGINIYITEDTEIEKGIIDSIINNFDNVILKLLFDYLYWLLKEDNEDNNDGIDKLSFLKYGRKDIGKSFDLEGTYNCLYSLMIKGNDNLTSSRVKYNNKKYSFSQIDKVYENNISIDYNKIFNINNDILSKGIDEDKNKINIKKGIKDSKKKKK